MRAQHGVYAVDVDDQRLTQRQQLRNFHILEGKRLNSAWVEVPGPEGSSYKVTNSSFIQGPVFLDSIRAFNGYLIAN